MTNVQSFLNAEYDTLEKEEAYLKEIMVEIRKFETELETEGKEVVLLERIIIRLKERLADFQRNAFPQIAIYLAKLSARDANRQYDSRFDNYILAFAEIEFDLSTLNHILNEIQNVFKRSTDEQMKADRFLSSFSKEAIEMSSYMGQTRELLFGAHGHSSNFYFKNMGSLGREKFIGDNVKEIKNSIVQLYSLKLS